MSQKCSRCGETLIREEREEGNLCFECFEAQVLETTPEENVVNHPVLKGGYSFTAIAEKGEAGEALSLPGMKAGVSRAKG